MRKENRDENHHLVCGTIMYNIEKYLTPIAQKRRAKR